MSIRQAFWPSDGTETAQGHFEIERLALRAPEVVFTHPPKALDNLLSMVRSEATTTQAIDESEESSQTHTADDKEQTGKLGPDS